MTDALVNDKPQFVRLFTENGLNILDYLTYNRLESLYQSVADGTLLYQLLQRRLVERLGTTGMASSPSNIQESPTKVAAQNIGNGPEVAITLFEVGLIGRRVDSFSSNLNNVKRNKENLYSLLLQVSGVLELLMGDVCQPFYYGALDLANISSKRRALKVFLAFLNKDRHVSKLLGDMFNFFFLTQ